MMNSSRLNRALSGSFLFYGSPVYRNTGFGYAASLESVNGNNGLYSKFISVSVKNADNTFEFPIYAVGHFYEGLYNFLEQGKSLEDNNETCKILVPAHCNNADNPIRFGAAERAFIDGINMSSPFGVFKLGVGQAPNGDSKETFYMSPGILLDSSFRPLLYLTVAGKYVNGEAANIELRAYIAHRVFNQEDSISKFILKKVVPFYLNNQVYLSELSIAKGDYKPQSKTWYLPSQEVKAKVILDPLDNLILEVKTPQSYEEAEQNVYAQLGTETAVGEIFANLDTMFQ